MKTKEKFSMFNNKDNIKSWLDSMIIQKYTINDDLTVDVENSVNLSFKNLIYIPIQFHYINGSFDCSNNKLISLKGTPNIIEHDFFCNINELTSLIYSPKKIGGNFDCSYNKITSLKGIPDIINENLFCYNNNLIYDYIPKFIKKEFIHDGNKELGIHKDQPIHEINAIIFYNLLQKKIAFKEKNGTPNKLNKI